MHPLARSAALKLGHPINDCVGHEWAADDTTGGAVHSAEVFDTLQESERAAKVLALMWRASELAASDVEVVATGYAALDAELPGGGWPRQSVVDILQPQPSVAEFRLLGPTLKAVAAEGGQVVLVGPPKTPHLAGFRQLGIADDALIWVDAQLPAERLWATEQVLKSDFRGAVVSWLAQARPAQLRRLQVHAQSCRGLAFLVRPDQSLRTSSAASLRVHVRPVERWALEVQVVKRRGPAMSAPIRLISIPGSLAEILTPAMLTPTRPERAREPVVGRTASPRVAVVGH